MAEVSELWRVNKNHKMRWRTVFCDNCRYEIRDGSKIHTVTWRQSGSKPSKDDDMDFCSVDCVKDFFKRLIGGDRKLLKRVGNRSYNPRPGKSSWNNKLHRYEETQTQTR